MITIKNFSRVGIRLIIRQTFHHSLTRLPSGWTYTQGLDFNSLQPHSQQNPDAPSCPPFFAALLDLVSHPQRFVLLWNWKSAVLSIVLRGPIFLIASIRGGLRTAVAALFAESIFCVVTAGCYGTIVQMLRDAEPQWLTGIFLTLIVPAVFQVFEYWLQWSRGTPHLRLAELVSVAVSALSALFNWYAMRRGTLLVGGEGGDFLGDLRHLPGLVIGFLAVVPKWITGRRGKQSAKVIVNTTSAKHPNRRCQCP